jgi:hypothetical protein
MVRIQMIARAGWKGAGEEVRDERSTHGVIGRPELWSWVAFVVRLLVTWCGLGLALLDRIA